MERTPPERAAVLLSAGLLVSVIVGGVFYLRGKNLETSRMTDQNTATISVSGEGKVSGAPDIAMLSLGVQTGRQTTAKLANDLLAKNMQAVIAAVKKAGVEDKDIQTQSVSLNPTYNYNNGSQTITGYEAMQSLQVKVRKMDSASDVLSAATAAGANQVGGVQFTIDDPETLRSQARTEAIAQAKAKAKTLAGELGMSLGKIRDFSTSDNGMSPPMPYATRAQGMGGEMAMDAAANIPLPQGEQDVVVYVSITYELN